MNQREVRWPEDGAYLRRGPAVIDIDVGRQLFVDDYLVAATDLVRTYHAARVDAASPVLRPETPLEMNGGLCPCAAPFNDGAWYDPADGLFKLWYQAGWFDGTALATSRDGRHWDRPALDVAPPSNAVIQPPPGHLRDGGLVWLDHDAGSAAERYKMMLYFRRPDGEGAELYTGPDGVHWAPLGRASTCGDNTSFFYDPFRRRYVFSVRTWTGGRTRHFHADADFLRAAQWSAADLVPWARADELDRPEPGLGHAPQLYDLNAVAYESLMLGAFAIFYGPPNPECERTGIVKRIDLQLGFSRDGFSWHRPHRQAFIACSRRAGAWDNGYIHAAGGLCLVAGDELHFYYGAFSGQSPELKIGETRGTMSTNSMYAGGHTGLAVLRRDGFASLDAGGAEATLLTRPVRFSGRRLFVNVAAPAGRLTVEVRDEQDRPIAPFTHEQCLAISADSTRQAVCWRGGAELAALAGRPVRLHFRLRTGRLYAFWVSPDQSGASRGYLAAGGPGYASNRDMP